MIVTDLPELARAAPDKEAAALETLVGSIDVVYASCQAILGHMVKVGEMLEVECGADEDRAALLAELLRASQRTSTAQGALLKAVVGLHSAAQATSAATTLEYLQGSELLVSD